MQIIPDNQYILQEAENKKHFELEILEPDKFIKANNLDYVDDPIYFVRDGVPTTKGLFSNEIFGLSKDDRANSFAYIDLNEYFIHPLMYKKLVGMDNKFREIVHGTKKYIVNSKGELIEDEEKGNNGIAFLKTNMSKIKIKTTDSAKRDVNIRFIYDNIDKMFMREFIVIPAYYRDVKTDGGYIGVGEVNQMYDSLIVAVRSLKETEEYGLSMSNASRGRIQEILVKIYNWFTEEPNLAKKNGIMKRAVTSKTSDYASRLVMSAPELKVESVDDLMVDLDHSAVPLASLCANLYPYIIFWLRRFFENEFSGAGLYRYKDKDTKEIKTLKVKDPLIEFSDSRLKKELERFMFGYSNRFISIEVPNDENKLIYMYFKGKQALEDVERADLLSTPLVSRKLTWCDLIFMAAMECSKDKTILITRYPMDSYFNQFATKITVSSTKETEPMWWDNKFYKYYPKIRPEDIGSNTSNRFIDTLNISNLHLSSIGGDYRRCRCSHPEYLLKTKTALIAGNF